MSLDNALCKPTTRNFGSDTYLQKIFVLTGNVSRETADIKQAKVVECEERRNDVSFKSHSTVAGCETLLMQTRKWPKETSGYRVGSLTCHTRIGTTCVGVGIRHAL